MNLKRNSPIPLYYQLVEALLEQIKTGELRPGSQLPAERELVEVYGISRMTVRQALAYLIRAGHLVAQQGLGTFVAEPKMARDPLHLLGFTEEMMLKGAASTSRVIEQSVITPPSVVAAGLGLPSSSTVVKIVRLRLSDGMPLLLETVYVPNTLCPGLETENLATQSLYALLEQQYGLHLSHARQTLEATSATPYESELFEVPAGTGMVLLEGITFLESDQPVEYFKAVYRGDRFRFELESKRNDWTTELFNAQRMSVVMR